MIQVTLTRAKRRFRARGPQGPRGVNMPRSRPHTWPNCINTTTLDFCGPYFLAVEVCTIVELRCMLYGLCGNRAICMASDMALRTAEENSLIWDP